MMGVGNGTTSTLSRRQSIHLCRPRLGSARSAVSPLAGFEFCIDSTASISFCDTHYPEVCLRQLYRNGTRTRCYMRMSTSCQTHSITIVRALALSLATAHLCSARLRLYWRHHELIEEQGDVGCSQGPR